MKDLLALLIVIVCLLVAFFGVGIAVTSHTGRNNSTGVKIAATAFGATVAVVALVLAYRAVAA